MGTDELVMMGEIQDGQWTEGNKGEANS